MVEEEKVLDAILESCGVGPWEKAKCRTQLERLAPASPEEMHAKAASVRKDFFRLTDGIDFLVEGDIDSDRAGGNCIGVTAIFTAFALQQGIDVSVVHHLSPINQKRHLSSQVNQGTIHVENTHPQGYRTKNKTPEYLVRLHPPIMLACQTFLYRSKELPKEQGARKIELIEQGIAVYPEFASAHLELGRLQPYKETEKKIRCYREAVRLEPELYVGWKNLGVTLQNKGRLEEALPALQRAHALNPEDTRTVERLAKLGRSLSSTTQRYT